MNLSAHGTGFRQALGEQAWLGDGVSRPVMLFPLVYCIEPMVSFFFAGESPKFCSSATECSWGRSWCGGLYVRCWLS